MNDLNFPSISVNTDPINNAQNIIETKAKRGRQSTKKSKKVVHDSSRVDNLTRKIQIQFFSFVIAFCNDAYKKVLKNTNL